MKLNTQSTIQDFINFFSAIPEDQWCSGTFLKKDTKQRCAGGHLGMVGPLDYYLGTPAYELDTRLGELVGEDRNELGKSLIAAVNNGENPAFQQTTPKARILTFLQTFIPRVEQTLVESQTRTGTSLPNKEDGCITVEDSGVTRVPNPCFAGATAAVTEPVAF